MSKEMLETAQNSIRQAAKAMGIDDKKVEALLEFEAEHVFEIELHGQHYPAFRIQHNSRLGPYKGGVRFHPQVNIDEARALATLMSLKTAAAGLPLGGGKGGIAVDPRTLSKADVEALSRRYVQHLAPHIGADKDIPAPDVNSGPEIIDWMADEYEKVSGQAGQTAFTGKSMGNGGSEGREAATGNGGAIVLHEFLKAEGLENNSLTVALQGFGNVGYFFAQAMKNYPNLKLIAVANSKNTWFKPAGIDLPATAGGKLPRPEELKELDGAKLLPAEDIVKTKADILVLAALEDAVAAENMSEVQSSVIVEMANGPISSAAEDYLLTKDVSILPDIIANSGGVIVSYLEWQQNLHGEHWSEAKVNKELHRLISKAAGDMLNRAKHQKISLKQAALEIGLKRLLK